MISSNQQKSEPSTSQVGLQLLSVTADYQNQVDFYFKLYSHQYCDEMLLRVPQIMEMQFFGITSSSMASMLQC
jgi:hypothetical protein